MFLASSQSDIVLLVGFDLTQPEAQDKIQEVKVRNHKGLFVQAIKSQPNVQWILVDHPEAVWKELAELPNFGRDSFDNVIALLNS
jgi:hypothetical protein